MPLTVKQVQRFWSTGVLEKPNSTHLILNGFYITPLLHHSITPADSRAKYTSQSSLWGQLKLRPSWRGFITLAGSETALLLFPYLRLQGPSEVKPCWPGQRLSVFERRLKSGYNKEPKAEAGPAEKPP